MKTITFCKIFLTVAASALLFNACNFEHKQPDQLSVAVEELEFESNGEMQLVEVNTNVKLWNASTLDSWITISRDDNQFSVQVEKYSDTNQDRTGSITVQAGEAIPVTITVTQLLATFYDDREVVKLQSATAGKGVNIVIMGDGYTLENMRKRTGKYELEMREAADHFFSVYPYKRYRDYFNVYMVAAISNEEGISVKSPQKKVDTKFSATMESENSPGLSCNLNLILNYMNAVSELQNVGVDDITVIVPINASIYAGTCWMYAPKKTFGDGSGTSVSLCPVNRKSKSGNIHIDFRSIVLHEAGGHGFAKLADEYVLSENANKAITSNDQAKALKQKNTYGWNGNVDFFSTITECSWSGFDGISRYEMVNAYEGAYYYPNGVWRPEYNSCMNNNVAYFNAPSRWAQVNRIKKLAGFSYTFEQFLQEEIVPEYPSETGTKSREEFVPLAPPVILER